MTLGCYSKWSPSSNSIGMYFHFASPHLALLQYLHIFCISHGKAEYISRVIITLGIAWRAWSPQWTGLRHSCHIWATRSDHDAHWSPKPRKSCFSVYITTTPRPLCLPWITKTAVEAQQATQRRQSGGRTIAMVAQGLPWSLNRGCQSDRSMHAIGQRRHFYGVTIGRPLCIHYATTAMHMLPYCLVWATFEQPNSLATFVRLFWTHPKPQDDYGKVWTSCVPLLNKHLPSFEPLTTTWPSSWSRKGGTAVAVPVLRCLIPPLHWECGLSASLVRQS